jgi:hypothetical protein
MKKEVPISLGCILSVLLPLVPAGPESLFEAAADPRALQTFAVSGLRQPTSGTVYPAGSLEQGGMPLGGLGTGYHCLDPDGRLGKCSIFNRLPAPLVLAQPFLRLSIGERRWVLATPRDGAGDVKSVRYFGHFPVAEVAFEVDAPVSVELRAWSPFLPGDPEGSNTPAAVFEVRLANRTDGAVRATLDFAPGGLPAGEGAPFTEGDWSGIQVTHRPIEGLPAWVRHTYALAALQGTAGMEGAAARAGTTLELGPRGRAAARFLLAWHQPLLRETSGRVERHRYAGRFADARAVAARAGRDCQGWLTRILAWQDVLYK